MSNPHQQAMFDALLGYKRKHGHPAMRGLLETVANVTSMVLVPEDKMQAVINACVGNSSGRFAEIPTVRHVSKSIDPVQAYKRWNNPPKKTVG